MEPYVWRVPVLLGLTAVAALVLFAAGVVGSCVARRQGAPGVRAGIAPGLGLLAVAAALGLRATAQQIALSLDVDPVFVSRGILGYLAPALFAAFAFVVGNWMLRGRWTGRRAALFYLWLLAFTVANVINRCAPGWCETTGLPFPWRSWSDANITINDTDVSAAMAVVGGVAGAAANLLTFVAVAGALTRGSPFAAHQGASP